MLSHQSTSLSTMSLCAGSGRGQGLLRAVRHSLPSRSSQELQPCEDCAECSVRARQRMLCGQRGQNAERARRPGRNYEQRRRSWPLWTGGPLPSLVLLIESSSECDPGATLASQIRGGQMGLWWKEGVERVGPNWEGAGHLPRSPGLWDPRPREASYVPITSRARSQTSPLSTSSRARVHG